MMMINEWTGYNHIEFTHTSHNLVVGARLLLLLLPINTESVPRQYLLFMRFYFYFVNFTAHGYRPPTTEREKKDYKFTRDTKLVRLAFISTAKGIFFVLLLFSTSFAVSPAIVYRFVVIFYEQRMTVYLCASISQHFCRHFHSVSLQWHSRSRLWHWRSRTTTYLANGKTHVIDTKLCWGYDIIIIFIIVAVILVCLYTRWLSLLVHCSHRITSDEIISFESISFDGLGWRGVLTHIEECVNIFIVLLSRYIRTETEEIQTRPR